MFQEFRIQLLFYFLFGFMYMLYFLRLTVFDASIRFDFRNGLIAIKSYLVMILNQYLTSERSLKSAKV